jgi:CrcB protein
MTVVEHAKDSAPENPRPAFAQPRLILFVFLGGAIGTAGREGISLVIPSAGGVPWAVLLVNVLGALILGFLLTALAKVSPETPARRDIRLFAGTGMMGGFTTYSSLATDTAQLFGSNVGLAVAYALFSVVAGVGAAALGILLARRLPAGARS